MQKFWIVWNGTGNPTVKHPRLHDAENEAERLTRVHGGTFMILEFVNACSRNDIVWDKIPDKDIPF